ncbi:mandelate racemase/muconate lactonizing enzyme family protein [Bradyrhizobium sp. 186]|uniref:mandelate racemase/muconate lactonizing enzyme family protein n=1 Tax=Bradyrhizobium sp. 186 TaxID=2782654 RepID=UPI002000CE1A|nr:mandelate racemase/muconate lactonizing enzyme family protein [Bradyrhizobium sp. 186]UPK37237.1 mandelate racemase/muconate lactonizing enzyme family protein [Bradyrhizobium sp. 186]
MKISRLRTHVAHLPVAKPFSTGRYDVRSIDCVCVFLETDEGLVGEGMCYVTNGRRLKVLREMIVSLEHLVVGLELGQSGSFVLNAFNDVRAFGRQGISALAISAVEEALWDVRGKQFGVNISHILGACRTTVPSYVNSLWLSATIDELHKEAEGLVRRGFRAIKMHVGLPDPDKDVERVRAVREMLGPDVVLLVDAAQLIASPEASIKLARRIEEFDIGWYEEPVMGSNPLSEAKVAAAIDIPAATGEYTYNHQGIFELLQLKAADILMPDLQRMGGPTEFLKAAAICEAFDIPVSSHVFPQMSLALMACVPNASYHEYINWFDALYQEPLLRDERGASIVPNGPGWGFAIDPSVLAD